MCKRYKDREQYHIRPYLAKHHTQVFIGAQEHVHDYIRNESLANTEVCIFPSQWDKIMCGCQWNTIKRSSKTWIMSPSGMLRCVGWFEFWTLLLHKRSKRLRSWLSVVRKLFYFLSIKLCMKGKVGSQNKHNVFSRISVDGVKCRALSYLR
jgi:hypothetical protein